MKSTFFRSVRKRNPDDTRMVGEWLIEKLRLRRSLKSLAAIDKDDFLRHTADDVMLQTLGLMTISWAIMERGLDDIVGVVFATDPGRAIQSTLPVTLDNKLDYLRKARASLPWLQPFAERLREMQRRAKLARTHRKNVTHGVLEVSETNHRVWSAKVLTFKGDASSEATVSYEAKAIFDTIREIDAIALDLQTLLGDLRGALDTAEKP
jgi:hypothetical protein